MGLNLQKIVYNVMSTKQDPNSGMAIQQAESEVTPLDSILTIKRQTNRN